MSEIDDDPIALTRRLLLASGLGLAAAGCASTGPGARRGSRAAASIAAGPFDSLRDYIAALEEAGLVLRIPRVDQDTFEGTALAYQARETLGMMSSPTLIFEEVRVNGEWLKGPLIINESGHLMAECIAFGLPVNRIDPIANFYTARKHWEELVAANGGKFPMLEPVEVPASRAACKEVVLRGDAIDLTRYAFIQGNPADAGRYINTGMVFIRDSQLGDNFGTYRCHLRGPREIAVNSEPGQTGWRQLMAAKQRGEQVARASIVLSPDPAVWLVSGSKLSGSSRGPERELAIAGGIRGRPVAVVRSETNDYRVPAHAEMIIEGEIPLDDLRPEGPYAEMYGYQGLRKNEAFWMRVTAVTHRRDPWIMNNFTGVTRGCLAAPGQAQSFYALRQRIPAVTNFFSDKEAVGVTCVAIRKTRPGEGLEVAQQVAETNFFAKVVIVVDEDVEVTSQEQVLSALGARWQPAGAVHVYEDLAGNPLDPSAPKRGRTSKIAIDATRRTPGEGGPAVFPGFNRRLLEEGAPAAFARAEARWGELLRAWRV
jgi:4-hydroxy-3-polyprenylbenzoate decarboxylase